MLIRTFWPTLSNLRHNLEIEKPEECSIIRRRASINLIAEIVAEDDSKWINTFKLI